MKTFTEYELRIEKWKPVSVDGFECLYEVSDLGRVRRSSDSCYRSVWKAGRLLSLSKRNKWGHIKVDLYSNNNRKSIWLHRLVLLSFVGNPPTDKHECAHNDGDPSNNRLINLRWVTSKENTSDSIKHGTFVVGSNHRNAKLHENDIKNIFSLRGSGMTQEQIGNIYGVHRITVKGILQRRKWKHVEVVNSKIA
jgi:hypothetical protein